MGIPLKPITIDLRKKNHNHLFDYVVKEARLRHKGRLAPAVIEMIAELKLRRENPNGLITVKDEITGTTLLTSHGK